MVVRYPGREVKVFLSTASRWALKPTQPAIQRALVSGGVFHPAKRRHCVKPTTFCNVYVLGRGIGTSRTTP